MTAEQKQKFKEFLWEETPLDELQDMEAICDYVEKNISDVFADLKENEYLDFSKMEVPDGVKREFVNTVAASCAKELLKTFLGCGLKTHIEQMVKEEKTNTEYVLTFQTMEMFLQRFKSLPSPLIEQ